ncbi:unnamed protein product [Cuscuta campestris]|uniref:RNase H type-1 domain-containing protein n=1 Tax=Cuscuta campestris TaxID=132261 RepID=A0A484KKN9_9ASTE|nr:unnamed protein product [Cuscuta campestris]
MHEVLPVRANLVRKGVSITAEYPRCLSIEETTLHGLVLCPFVVQCLREVGGERGNVEPSFAQWFAALWKESSREFVACVAIILWEIWNQRNQLVWNNKYMQPKTLVARALQWYQLWQQAKQEDPEVARTRNTFHNQWEPPVLGALKCNVDASFNPNTHLARVGMVVRDSNGYFVKGASRGLGQVEDACMAEAIGEKLREKKSNSDVRVLGELSKTMKICACVSGHIFNRASGGLSPAKTLSFFLPNFPSHFSAFHNGVAVRPSIHESYLHHSKSKFKSIKKLDDAILVYRHMVQTHPHPPIYQFNLLLDAIGKMGRYSDAVSLFRDIFASGVVIDNYTLSIAANSLARLHRVDLGFAILGSHLKLGLVPNVVFFSTLLKGLFLQGRVHNASWLFQKLLNEKLCKIDEVTLLILIDGLCKAGHTGKAIKLLHFFDEKGNCKPDVHAYNAIIDSLCKDKMMDDALALITKMREKGIPPDVVTYNSLIHGLCTLSRWEEVKEILKTMADSRIPLDVLTYNILVCGFCKEGWINYAENIIETMIKQGVDPDVVTYNALMQGYCLLGKIDSASELLNTMIQRGCQPDVHTYSILINGYCKSKCLDKAMILLEKIPTIGLKPTVVAYNSMLDGLFQDGRFSDAEKLFNKMVENQEYPNLVTYTIILDGFCKNDRVPQALSLLRMMETKSPIPDIISYSTVINGLFSVGKSSSAIGLFNALPSKGLLPDMIIFRSMISGLCKEGLLEDAKGMLKKMEKNGVMPDSVAYNVLIRGLLKKNEHCDAILHLDEMLKLGFLPDDATCEILLKSILREGPESTLLHMLLNIKDNDQKSRS